MLMLPQRRHLISTAPAIAPPAARNSNARHWAQRIVSMIG
jgi:hypothetical protein